MAAGLAPQAGEGPASEQKRGLRSSMPKPQLAGLCPTDWTAKDDLLLMKSMEAGYALEALARGAMALSRRFSLAELEGRWRALLLDKAVADDASRRLLAVCGQAVLLGDLSGIPSLPSKRREGSPAQSLRPHYVRARKRARKDALERRRRLLLDPTFGALYADEDDLSVGLADPGMPTPQDMHSLAGMEEPLLAHLEAFEERTRGSGRSQGGGSSGWEAEMEAEQGTRVRKRKELLGYHHAQHARRGDVAAGVLEADSSRQGVGYDLLVVRHEAEGQEAEGVRLNTPSNADQGVGVGELWGADVNGAVLEAGGTQGGGIEHDMLQEMFSVLTGDMADESALESPGAQEVEQPRAHGGVEGEGVEEQRGDRLRGAASHEMEGEATRQSGSVEDKAPRRQSLGLEVAPLTGERSGAELSFGVSDGGGVDTDAGVHVSSSGDEQHPREGASGSEHGGGATARGEGGEGAVPHGAGAVGLMTDEKASAAAGQSAESPSPAAVLAGDAAASGAVPLAGFQLAPPQRSSPWSTPRLGPQSAPTDPHLLQDLDGLASWSLAEKKPAAPSPLFQFARGSGPSPTFTPLPGADATDALDFLPLPSAALPALTGAPASRQLLSGPELTRPSSSPALAPHTRHALPRLADQLQLMEEDTRSEPGDIARFRDRHLMRSASLDRGRAERTGGGRHGGRTEQAKVEEEQEAHSSEEEESLCFSDVEAVVLDLDLEPDDETGDAARRRARRLQSKYRRAMLRLEQMADSATGRQLTRERALAVLYGRRLRYLIRDSEILVGRSTAGQSVDVDLAREGPATKVSRKQASIKLKKDGNWYIKNLGKRELQVNNRPVEAGSREKLDNKCLLEIGGLRLVFEINSKLVAKVLSRMPADL